MPPTDWTIDTSHSSISFTARHMVFAKVRGTFTSWRGTISVDENDPTNVRVDIRIEAAGIDTHDQTRDTHLRSVDFLDVYNHPEFTFTSTRTERSGEHRFRLAGNLTMRGATHEIVLDTNYLGTGKDPGGRDRIAYAAKGVLDRTKWGLVWNAPLEAGGFLVGDTIEVILDVQAIRG